MRKYPDISLFVLFVGLLLVSCKSKKLEPASYDPEGSTITTSKPITYQIRKTWRLDGGKISVSNEFPGARLNDFKQINDTLFTALIEPENSPVNKSPWYAFKIWSDKSQEIYIQMEYQEDYQHRYYPDISNDLKTWQPVDSSKVSTDSINMVTTISLKIGPQPTYLAAQEVMTSDYVYQYINTLKNKEFISSRIIGYSTLGKEIPLLTIGNKDSRKIIVVLGRQHPPEATGFLALQKFIDEIVNKDQLAQEFREEFLTLLIPMVNPDGVDQGHWRHNAGGVDLNRDWSGFNQPETRAISKYLVAYMQNSDKKIYFQIDFHSTQEDLFYVFEKDKPTLLTGFTHRWLDEIESNLPDYKANRILSGGSSPVSTYWFNKTFQAEAVTYEVGDDSRRSRIQQISEEAAQAMMKLLLQENL